MNSKKYNISAIIPTYNSISTISICIKTLLKQSIKVEIIVVDDGSTDDTIEALKKFGSQITLLTQLHHGPAIARNNGAKLSRGDILVFADSDMYFTHDYIETLTAPIISSHAVGTYTDDERVSNWENIWARCWNIEENWEPRKRFPKGFSQGTDFRAILRSEFERVGGFDDIGYTDSWTLFQKLKLRPTLTHATCFHKNPSSLIEVFSHARWIAKRPYKLGYLGNVLALIRSSLPISIVVGIYKSTLNFLPQFIIFKIIYDLGRFIGIVSASISGSTKK